MLSEALARVTVALLRGAVGDLAMDFSYDLIHFIIYSVMDFNAVVLVVFASLATALDRP